MRWPLRYQILVPFAAVMVALLATVSVLNAYLAARQSFRQTVQRLRGVAHALADPRFPLTDTVLRKAHGLSEAEFVLIADGSSLLAASLPLTEALPQVAPTSQWQNLELDDTAVVAGERYFHAALNLAPQDAWPHGAVLHLLYPERSWRDARWQAAYPPLLVGAVALVPVALLAGAIAGRLSRPIVELRRQVGRIAHGDFQPLPLPPHDDELRDLTRSVNALAGQLDEMQRVVKRSERLTLLGQLSGGLAHHLRNDVTGARIAVQLHQRHCRQLDQESLAVALRQLTLTEQHLQRFLAAGRPQPPSRTDCDLHALIDELVQLVGPACRHRRVDLRVDATDAVRLAADEEQLRHLLLNLVLNAVEAVPPGGQVRIVSRVADGEVAIAIHDTGPGPPAAVADRLFEPFSTGKPEGIGLGLTVARQIAEAHGGSLDFSAEGGTCFTVTLPLEFSADLAPVSEAVR
ncbi:MAG TPA: HAMP domain-containing sensor histidine kinase [Pirellulales bacterium]|jgi:signal transduction histidine kinase|nr:HAMP domain-containing sensor histidine kinase [Pirellulales bacterium]